MEQRFNDWEAAVRWLREQPDQQSLVQAAYYDDPLIDAARRYAASAEWAAIRALLPARPGAALDVGAGRGIASFALAQSGFAVTALEPDGSALVGAQAIRDLASQNALPIEVCQEFSEKLPFADGRFDVVFARAVLHHTKDLESACAEFFRVLKPGGMLLAVREHVISRQGDLPEFLRIHPLHHLYGGENAFLLSQYVRAIEHAGFRLERMIAPLESPINYAPHTRQSLQREMAKRIARGVPGISRLIAWMLGLPGLWTLLLPSLERVDHRSGRLYSFVCRRS